MHDGIEQLKAIRTFPSLVKYLRDELDWPIDDEDVEDLTFEYDAEELGLDPRTAAKIKEIKQLRPLVTNQPWGIFYINFEPRRLPVVALRRILSSLVIKKRASANPSQRAAWQLHDLLFISSYGESSERAITFAHFSEDSASGNLPTLRVLNWDAQDTVLHLEDAHRKLKTNLVWPEREDDIESWRSSWSSAFTLRHRQVITTSRDLSIQLAALATRIRKRANAVLAIESENGPFRKLYKAFQEALIHDLSEDDFADMYAQTIAYGMLSARVSRPAGIIADNLIDMVPTTNPFLRELLSTFITVGGRRGKIDFDELGVNDVVELLNDERTNMEAVLRDFGDRNPQEDPVIHFYELFLKEYDPKKRMKRGVFYTPRPVVSFIVRSVDEILRTEFKLEDGLADTTTWGEMQKRHEGLEIPEGVSPDAPFVQILDPATGTGTFLVEVIDVIYRTMRAKWSKEGHSEKDMREIWNDYVPRHLLPRLYGFELMMAPYAIAHMKIGLKLHETKYSFLSSERARIYLTNTLEEPKDFSGYFEQMAPALAHEAKEANRIKKGTPITVVIGNPPYSRVSQNQGEFILKLLDAYKQPVADELNQQPLNDDYIKFICLVQHLQKNMPRAIIGMITNHTLLSGILFRGVRQKLLADYSCGYFIDLHGNSNIRESSPDGSKDKNVFDILTGVAITILVKTEMNYPRDYRHADFWGTRESKYERMLHSTVTSLNIKLIHPHPPQYFLTPKDFSLEPEYKHYVSISRIFPVYSSGLMTVRDNLAIAFKKEELKERFQVFRDSSVSDKEFQYAIPVKTYRKWELAEARRRVRADTKWLSRIQAVNYRPFDKRFIFYSSDVVTYPNYRVMDQFAKSNLGLITSRINKEEAHAHEFVTREMTEIIFLSSKSSNNAFLFPLWLYATGDGNLIPMNEPVPNLASFFVQELEHRLSIKFKADDQYELTNSFSPENAFHFIYAVTHSPTYRTRYAEFLKIDFPRVPLTSDIDLFRQLCARGADLVSLHLLEDDYPAASWNASKPEGESPLKTLITRFAGTGDAEVAKGYPKYKSGSVFINPSQCFEGVPEEVWNFHIGGYQVCNKWLKDRRGRTLSPEDITHYQRVVVALNETIRLMAEIDEVIEEHGGWPLPGSQDAPQIDEKQSNLPFA